MKIKANGLCRAPAISNMDQPEMFTRNLRSFLAN